MSYYFSKIINDLFENSIYRVKAELKREGFGVLTEIDVKETLKKKLNEDFRPYVILGACNPSYAFKALSAEDKIGTMLPCNVIVQELAKAKIEVAAVDPIASMKGVENPKLGQIASEIQKKLKSVINNL